MEKLSASAVEDILKDCLFKEGEDHSNAVLSEGITATFGFHPERLEKHKQAIRELLYELPPEFRKGVGGGGWSFLNACVDKNGNQWGEHQNIEQLLVLGIATKQAGYCTPRDFCRILPGGMPYIFVVDAPELTKA